MTLAKRLLEGISPKKAEVLAKQFDMTTEEVVEAVKQLDPTPNAQYATWVLKQLKAGNVELPEDSAGALDTLTKYGELVKGRANIDTDINSFATMGDLWQAVDDLAGYKSRKDVGKNLLQKGMAKVHSGGGYDVYAITTAQAAAKAGRNTNWCIKDPSWARKYLSRGPLYLFTRDDQTDGDPRVALATIDNSMELKDKSNNNFSGKAKDELWRELAMAMDDDVAYRHFGVAIERAIALRRPLPSVLENTKEMLNSQARDEYFKATYGDANKAYEMIDQRWWFTTNDHAIDYSLKTGTDLPDMVRHRLLNDIVKAIAWATAAQKNGIIKHWDELESAILDADEGTARDAKELKEQAMAAISKSGYRPSSLAMKEAMDEWHAEAEAAKKRAEDAARRRAQAGVDDGVDEEISRMIKGGGARTIFETGGWSVTEMAPLGPGVGPDEFVERSVALSREDMPMWNRTMSAVSSLWDAMARPAKAQWYRVPASRFASEADVPVKAWVLAYDPAGEGGPAAGGEKAGSYLILEHVLKGGTQDAVSVVVPPRSEWYGAPGAWGRVGWEPPTMPGYVRPLLQAVLAHGDPGGAEGPISALLRQHEDGYVADTQDEVDNIRRGVAPITSAASLARAVLLHGVPGRVAYDMSALEMSAEEAISTYSPALAPPGWEAAVVRKASEPAPGRGDARQQVDAFTKALVAEAQMAWEPGYTANSLEATMALPLMRAYLEAGSSGRREMERAGLVSQARAMIRPQPTPAPTAGVERGYRDRAAAQDSAAEDLHSAFMDASEGVDSQQVQEDGTSVTVGEVVRWVAEDFDLERIVSGAARPLPEGMVGHAKLQGSYDDHTRTAVEEYERRMAGGGEGKRLPAASRFELPDIKPAFTVESLCRVMEV